jgi:hypothetical protein
VDAAGAFHEIPHIDDSRLAEIFAREVLSFLVGQELLNSEWAERILSWPHTGFNVHGGRGPGPCPGDPFPPHSPVDKDAGEWRAESSPLVAWCGPRRRWRPRGWGSTCSGRCFRWNGCHSWSQREKWVTGKVRTARSRRRWIIWSSSPG